jgi:predicted RecB family nuclease
VSIYVDLEGLPDEDTVYLAGVRVCRAKGQPITRFWADSKKQEQTIAKQLGTLINEYENATVFVYGSYETAWFKRMRAQSTSEENCSMSA